MRFSLCSLAIIIGLIINSLTSFCQPFFEPASLSGSYFPKGERQRFHGEKSFMLNLSVPLKLAPGRLLVLSPFQEYRNSYEADGKWYPDLYSTAIPVSFVSYFNDSNWVFNLTVINRWNRTEPEFGRDSWQLGGAVINTFRLREGLKIKFGLYYNREFFSDFFVPLAGLEWKISKRLQLFGTLPNNMKMEYRATEKIYAGAVFRSITNSYRNLQSEGGYFKLTDNQVGLFADASVFDKMVFSLEAGRTFFKTAKGRIPDSFYERKSDSFYVRAGISYRIRFDN